MKTRYIISLAAGALVLAGCQREELAEPGVLSGKEGVVKFAPSVGGIVSGVKSSSSEDASSATYTQTLTLASEDGKHTLPMNLSVTSLETGDGTKATLINENGGITDAQFATAVSDTFMVAAWDKPASGDPAQIIPDKTISGYTTTDGKYQKVMYRTKDVAGKDLVKPYWMTMQPMPSTITVVSIDQPADDEYIWKDGEWKTFYAYANVPSSATMALLANAGGQKMSCTGIPTQDILMGYYSYNGGGTGTASIKFHHPLAAVKVKTGTLASGVTISSVAIENVYGKGELMVKQEGDSFTWTRSDGTPFKDENLMESIPVTCDGDAVLVLPHMTFPSKARIRVELEQGGQTFNVYSPLSGSWSNGTVYTYTIGYNPPLEDLLPGKFSVSATEYVQFSRGNLYCTRSGSVESYTYKFAFEKNQYDCRTRENYNSYLNGVFYDNSPANTSGAFQWDLTTVTSDFGAFTNNMPTISPGDFLDFGAAMGPDSDWHTLSYKDWSYLLNSRGDGLYKKDVTILEMKGMVFAPDNYKGTIESEYSLETWKAAEATGLVFLPYSGWVHYNGQTSAFNDGGYYWMSDAMTNYELSNQARMVCASTSQPVAMSCQNGRYEHPVRLVQRFEKPVQYVKIGNLYWATENLAITESGKREYNGTGHVIGDYFQWAASYDGYGLDPATSSLTDLLIYSSFTNTLCGDVTDAFTFINSREFKKESAPYHRSTTGYNKCTYSNVLTESDDIASIALGGLWRMPTIEEFQSLYDNYYWAYDETDKGFYVFNPDATHEAKSQSKTMPADLDKSQALLFFPVGGLGGTSTYNGKLAAAGESARYWSNTHDPNFSAGDFLKISDRVIFNPLEKVETKKNYYTHIERYYGAFIRPVMTAPTE